MADKTVDIEEVKKHLPSEEAINEYVEFVNKEMATLKELWTPMFTGETKTSNELIINHCVNMTDYFTNALKIAITLKNPELVAQILEQVPDNPEELAKHMHGENCHCGE